MFGFVFWCLLNPFFTWCHSHSTWDIFRLSCLSVRNWEIEAYRFYYRENDCQRIWGYIIFRQMPNLYIWNWWTFHWHGFKFMFACWKRSVSLAAFWFEYRRGEPTKRNIRPQIYGVWQRNFFRNISILVFHVRTVWFHVYDIHIYIWYIYICMFVYVCLYIYMYIYIYICCIYIYIHDMYIYIYIYLIYIYTYIYVFDIHFVWYIWYRYVYILHFNMIWYNIIWYNIV